MHHRCKSWRKPIHARKGNSLWARIVSIGKSFVIARALLGALIFFRPLRGRPPTHPRARGRILADAPATRLHARLRATVQALSLLRSEGACWFLGGI